MDHREQPSKREQFVALVNRVAELLAPDEGYDELAERVFDEWRVQLSEERPTSELYEIAERVRACGSLDNAVSYLRTAVRSVDSLRPPEALEMFAVTRREAIWAIWPRRVQAEAYQSGFSLPVETSIETVRVLRGADSLAAPEETNHE